VTGFLIPGGRAPGKAFFQWVELFSFGFPLGPFSVRRGPRHLTIFPFFRPSFQSILYRASPITRPLMGRFPGPALTPGPLQLADSLLLDGPTAAEPPAEASTIAPR